VGLLGNRIGRVVSAAGVVGLCTVLAACSAVDSGGRNPTERTVGNFLFLGDANAPPAPTGPATDPLVCPRLNVSPEKAAYTLYARGKEGDAASVRYQADFTQRARECDELGIEAGIRMAVTGRLLQGPAGTGGASVDLPIRFTITDDDGKVVTSHLAHVKVTIPAGQTMASFSHVESMGSLPIPQRRFAGYQFEVGFEQPKGR
jgi:hypothetical protein